MNISEEVTKTEDNKTTISNPKNEEYQLIARIKELEEENNVLRNRNEDSLSKDVEEYINEIYNMMADSFKILKDKDDEITRLNERLLEDNAKWKGYIKLLVDHLDKKNTLIDNMKEEMDKFLEKTKKQELNNRENANKLVSYEELIQIDQQLLKQYKQIETELNNKIRKLEDENSRYVKVIKIINENTQKKIKEYNKEMDKQKVLINHLSSIVENFRGRYLYNNIGKQNGIINKINKKSSLNENFEKEIMNPLEYELSIIWRNSQTRMFERKCELLELSLNLVTKEDSNFEEEELDPKKVFLSKDSSVIEILPIYSNYIDRIIGIYDIFCKCNLLLQYFQYKALKYLGVKEIDHLLNNGEVTGIIQWVCNIIVEIGFITLLLGKIIIRTRECCLDGDLSGNSIRLNSKILLPLKLDINNILKWINNLFQDALNDNLNQSITYNEIKELKNKLYKLVLDSNTDNLTGAIPICCLDSIMNLNITLTVIGNINFKSIDKTKLDELYKKSMIISEKFYSKCGCLSLNGTHYPIDDRLYYWNSLYWDNIFQEGMSNTFNNSFLDMVNSQKEIYEIIQNGSIKQSNIMEHFDKLLYSVQELDLNLDQLLNPVHIETNQTCNNSLLELFFTDSFRKKLFDNIDEQFDKNFEFSNEVDINKINDIKDVIEHRDINKIELVSNLETETEMVNYEAKISNAVSESPKRQKLENTIKMLNEKIQSLKKELTNKEVLYSSFGAMNIEYKKLQDHKQLLMHKIEEQEFEMKIKQDQIRRYEDIVNQLKQESELLKRNLENLQNLPKIKAYSELDVLEPVYLRRLVRLMSNKLYEIEMNNWNEQITRNNPNFILKSNFNKRLLVNQIYSNKSLHNIAQKLFGREEKKLEDKLKDENDGNEDSQKIDLFSANNETIENLKTKFSNIDGDYLDLLTIINEYKDLRNKILLHRCSMPIYDKKSSKDFKKNWEDYVKRDSEFRYKLYIMKRALDHLLTGLNENQSEHKHILSDSCKNKNIGKLSLKLPFTSSISKLKNNKNDPLQVNDREWNEIIRCILNI